MDIDIAGLWRNMRADSADVPRPGARQQTPGEGITITVAAQCQTALPLPRFAADEVTVTVTSQRPRVGAQVWIGANLNSADVSYQGPTTTVGQGQFTATSSQVDIGFVVLPSWPVVGVGAVATWEDGAPQAIALTYEQLACDPPVWWRWPIQILSMLSQPFLVRSSPVSPRSNQR